MSRPRKRLLTFNDPQPLRIDRRLAMEIGFLESVVLLQLEFLISISHNERDGQFWTYNTLKQLKERHFPWLSQATICRTLQVLEDKGLIVRAHYNRSGFDRTQWFALNYAGIADLNSVVIGEDAPISHSAKRMLQTETAILQEATPILQAGATIPETTPEITPENNHNSDELTSNEGNRAEDAVVALCQALTDSGVSRRKAERLVRDNSPERIHRQLAMLEYRKADDPAAVLVRAIEEDWAAPAEYRRIEADKQRQARLRLKRELKAREEADRAAAERAMRDLQDQYWASLGRNEQEAIEAEAEVSLRARSPFLFSNGGPRKNGVMYRTMIDAERRRLVAERMAKGA